MRARDDSEVDAANGGALDIARAAVHVDEDAGAAGVTATNVVAVFGLRHHRDEERRAMGMRAKAQETCHRARTLHVRVDDCVRTRTTRSSASGEPSLSATSLWYPLVRMT